MKNINEMSLKNDEEAKKVSSKLKELQLIVQNYRHGLGKMSNRDKNDILVFHLALNSF